MATTIHHAPVDLQPVPGFCVTCGTILSNTPDLNFKQPAGPGVLAKRYIGACVKCGRPYSMDDLPNVNLSYHIGFNDEKSSDEDDDDDEDGAGDGGDVKKSKKNKKKGSGETEALPCIERVCSKCGNNSMYFAAVQTRSADEGQTLFFTCTITACSHKETEYS